MTLPASITNLIARALTAAELGVVLEMDAEDIDTWRVGLELPGPFDLAIDNDDGDVTVTAGPVELTFDDGQVQAVLDLPGPDLMVETIDGKVQPPRFVPDTDVPALRMPKRTLVRSIGAGEFDDQLEVLLVAEKAGARRRAIVNALSERQQVRPVVVAEVQEVGPVVVTDPLDLPRRTLARRIAGGVYDGELEAMTLRELNGHDRGGVLRRLRRRADEIGE